MVQISFNNVNMKNNELFSKYWIFEAGENLWRGQGDKKLGICMAL
jgi:hypothetical protein